MSRMFRSTQAFLRLLILLTFGIPRLCAALELVSVDPPAGTVESLERITITFSAPVNGISSADFLINGIPASSVSGLGSTYNFYFKAPPFGPVSITWGPLHSIQDLSQPPVRFDASVAGANWNYEFVDPRAPELISVFPPPGVTVRQLGQVEVQFNRPVSGIDATDLLLNGLPALQVEGLGAGPYLFRFAPPGPGLATLTWAANTGIQTESEEPRKFEGAGWSYPVAPLMPERKIFIREILSENLSGLKDEDLDPEDWIELFNAGDTEVDLAGWSLSNDSDALGLWVFPSLVLPPSGSTLVWASGKDRTNSPPNRYLHTNFKLNSNGGFLQLSGPELPAWRSTTSTIPLRLQISPTVSMAAHPFESSASLPRQHPPSPTEPAR